MRLNGLDVNVEIEGRGLPLLLLHGFTGSVRAWGDVRPALAHAAHCIWVDAIGHGHSAAPSEPERYSLDWSSRDLVALLDTLGLETVNVVGYSMGGRAALHLAVHAPERINRLLLESASPGLADETDRRSRIAADEALAQRLEDLGIEAFVQAWEGLPLLQLRPHVTRASRDSQHALRLGNNPMGLANSLRGMGTGLQAPLWAQLRDLDRPVTLIVGEHDPRYRQMAERMCQLLPSGELHVVAAAGHTVHLDQPNRFAELVQAALDRRS